MSKLANDPSVDVKVGRPRGRPRNVDADQLILVAALAEYAEFGWAGFTLEGVARRAGVGKSTMYRRWTDRDALLTDAVKAHSQALESVDTGSVRSDLEALAANLLRFYLDSSGFASLRVAVDAAGASEPIGDFADAVVEMHRTAATRILERAVARGELAAEAPIDTMVLCLYGGVTMQRLTLGPIDRDLDDAGVTELTAPIVDFVLASTAASRPD